MPPSTLILTALRYEALAIARRLQLTFSSPTTATGARGSGRYLRLYVVGPRCGHLGRLEGIGDCGGVVMAGLAGGLDPTLEAGEVVVDVRSDMAVPAGRWRRGGIYTAPHVVATAAEKASLFAATGALAVDMENEFARDFAAKRGVPFLGIRAVSDRADEPLDPATLRWVDPAGGLRAGRVAADLCRRPSTLPAVLRLGRRSRLAVSNLAAALQEILGATSPVARVDAGDPTAPAL